MEDSTMIALSLFGISTVANAATLVTVYGIGTRLAVIEALFGKHCTTELIKE